MLAPALRATAGEIHAADRDPPALRLGQPQQAGRRRCSSPRRSRRRAPRLLPAAARARNRRARAGSVPDSRTRRARTARPRPPGRELRAFPRRARQAAPPAARGFGSATASPSALAWYSAPSRRSGRYSSGASTRTVRPGLQAEPAAHEADTDRDRDQRHAQGRGQLEDGAGQEGDPERPHRRPPIALADVRERRRLSPGPVERPQRGQPAHHVEEVGRQEPQGEPPLPGPLLRVAPDQPHEHRDERQRGEHDQRRAEVDRGHERQDGHGNDTGEHELRQVPGEVGLEAVDALHRGRDDLPAPRRRPPTSAGARRRRSTRSSRSSESTAWAARRPATSNDQASAPRAAKASASRSTSVHRAAERGAVEGSGDDPRQQERLQQHDESAWPRRRRRPEPAAAAPRSRARAAVSRGARYGLGRGLDARRIRRRRARFGLVAAEPLPEHVSRSSPGRGGSPADRSRRRSRSPSACSARTPRRDGEAVRKVRARDHHARIQAREQGRHEEDGPERRGGEGQPAPSPVRRRPPRGRGRRRRARPAGPAGRRPCRSGRRRPPPSTTRKPRSDQHGGEDEPPRRAGGTVAELAARPHRQVAWLRGRRTRARARHRPAPNSR